MKDLISVIIPVYNVEPYLPTCIESVLNQTFQNLEIILVDDGSTDRSGVICDEYSSKDSRIKVIHKNNGGLSSARNVGLDIARGSFIAFIDSDDWIHELMYEKLYSTIIETKSDISTCGTLCVVDNSPINVERNSKRVIVRNHEEVLRDLLYNEKCIRIEVWNKLYKKEVINNIRFKEGQVFEDIFFERMVLKSVKSISTIKGPYHFYRVSRPGNTSSSFSEKKLSMFHELNDFIKDLKAEGFMSIAQSYEVDAIVTSINLYIAANKHNASKKVLSTIYKWFIYFYEGRRISSYRFRLFKISPRLYLIVRQLRNLLK